MKTYFNVVVGFAMLGAVGACAYLGAWNGLLIAAAVGISALSLSVGALLQRTLQLIELISYQNNFLIALLKSKGIEIAED